MFFYPFYMAEEEKDDKMRENLPKLSTPALVPWLPPGKPKESTFNAYAHKKNQVRMPLIE